MSEQTNNNQISILEYKDYRKFLNDVFNQKKKINKNFTYGKWAKEIGLSSVSGLTMILKGQRQAGKNIQELIIKNLQLDHNEANHFKNLVKLQKQAKGDSSLVVYMMDNLKLEEKIEDEQRPIQFKWQMGFLREAVKWQDFKSDDDWLRNKVRLDVEKGELESILKKMEKEKIVSKNKDRYQVNTNYKAKAVDTRYFQYLHKEFLRIIDQSYEVEFELRSLEYRMILINKKDVKRAKQRLAELLAKFVEEFDQKEASSEQDDIYLTSIHLTPFSK